MNIKDIFMNGFKSKICYSFTYKDLAEFEAVINFYEQQVKKQKEVINKAIKYINKNLIISSILDGKETYCLNNYTFDYKELLDILKEVSE